MKYLFFVLFASIYIQSQAQEPIDIYSIKNVDSILLDYIRTVEFSPLNEKQNLPIIENGTILQVEFDDSYGEYIDYYYTVFHCDRNWNITPDIERSAYLDGQDEIEIDDFFGSASTNLSYYHYEFTFPNQDIQLLWTGNYMLVVYDNDGTIAFTKRFYKVSNQVTADYKLVRPNKRGEYNTHQAIRLSLGIEELSARDPISNIYIHAWQNRFNESGYFDVQGDFISNQQIQFYENKLFSWPGLKEYRSFDTRRIEFAGRNVAFIQKEKTEDLIFLEVEKDRHHKSNFTEFDLNGGFALDNQDRRTDDPSFTSEYPKITFTLKVDYPIPEDVYVLGEFNDYKKHENYRMTYVEQHESYMLEVALKQGYYDYLFGVDEGDKINYTRFEGSSFETENDYYFMIYYRPLEGFYDQIIGSFKVDVNQIGR